jgi:hypothetical protein
MHAYSGFEKKGILKMHLRREAVENDLPPMKRC